MKRHVLCILLLTLAGTIPGIARAQEEKAPEAAPAETPAVEEATTAEAATDAEAPPAESAEPPKAKVAIFPFQTRPRIDNRVAGAMVAKLTAALEDAPGFELLDRPAMANLSTEIDFNRRGEIKQKSAAAWGAERDIDFIVTGMVVAAGKGHGGMGIGGVRISSKAISLAIEVRVIDCAAGEAIFEDTLKEEKLGLGLAVGTVEFDPESTKGREMVAAVLGQTIRAVRTTVAPPTVLEVDANAQTVIIEGGGELFAPGERWDLFQYTDASTMADKRRKNKGDKMGAVRITEVGDDTTTGEIIDGGAAAGAIARFDKEAKD